MYILYAFLITLLVYPTIGTFLYALVESLKTSTKVKISIITIMHPLLTGFFIWFVCSFFNKEIAEAGVLCVAGTLLRLPFSDKKYFSTLVKDSGVVRIEYFSELIKRKTISLKTSEIIDLTQNKTTHLIDKPSELTVTLSNQVLTFKILDKTTQVFL